MANLARITQPTVQAIYRAWEDRGNVSKGHRPHLGASLLGNECRRALWYTFRWATDQSHEGRLLRLFDRGQLEEDRFVADLKAAGIEVHAVDDRTGSQFQFSDCGGHVGGSMDGVGRGFEEAPTKYHVLEFKTHNDKNFEDLQKNGVELAKPLHFVQMQLYMHWSGLDRAFYLAVNKNNDELYSERIKYNSDVAENALRKAWDTVKSDRPLERMSEDPSFFKCKFCNHQATCHQQAPAAVNCRTCVHATPELNGSGTWSCSFYNGSVIPVDEQRRGCPEHRYIPELISWAKQVDACAEENWIEYEVNGKRFRNGPKGTSSYPSDELAHLNTGNVADPGMEALRAQFDAKVIPCN